MTTSTSSRPLRADARRNRDAILNAARAAVAERGGDIALEDVARSAGVGIGTLYRHFPTRQELLEATFVHEATELADRAHELADAPDPLEAVVTWLRLAVELGSHGRSMGAAVMASKKVEGSELQVAWATVVDGGTALLQRAQDAGQVRPGLLITDLVHLVMNGIAQAHSPEQAERMFDVVIAGIRN